MTTDEGRDFVERRVTEWARQQQELHATILEANGADLHGGTRLLDLGCGDGALVAAYRQVGIDAYGCDFGLSGAEPGLLAIDGKPYRLPFPDRWFDAVVSSTVMEHVQNWEETLLEVARVMKPNGLTLHLFPARLRPIEAHVLVPFAGVLQRRWWLRMWAWIGVRNRFQHEMSSAEAVGHNESFLKNHTTYLTRRQVHTAFDKVFSEVRFCDREMIVHGSSRARKLQPVVDWLPAIASLYGAVAMTSVLARGSRLWPEGDRC